MIFQLSVIVILLCIDYYALVQKKLFLDHVRSPDKLVATIIPLIII